MNPAHIHLALNNFPPFANVIGILLLVGGMLFRNAGVVRAGLAVFVLAALVTAPVFFTGRKAEHIVEGLQGVNDVAIHPHEEAGEWAIWVLSIEGVAALASLIAYRRREFPRWVAPVMLIVALFGTSVVFRTAFLGGRIHHPETEMNR